MHRCSVALLFVAACSSDPGEFRPAKGAHDYPPTRDAYRVPSPPDQCDRIGVIHAEGINPIEDIATTAARHGGTHYVVSLDRSSKEYTTHTAGTVGRPISRNGPAFATSTSTTTEERHRHLAADVFRCDE